MVSGRLLKHLIWSLIEQLAEAYAKTYAQWI